AYIIMKNSSEKLHIIEFNENENIKIKDKSANLYEKWCLIKILSVFTMVYGFRFSDKNESLNDIITRCLQENDTIRGSSFTLECDKPKIEMTIDYDKSVRPNEKYSYRPDFVFTIKFYNELNEIKILKFCMDAKYKNYDAMRYPLDYDIENVAHKRYISDMKTKYHIDMSGSYILHCNDVQRKITFTNQGDTSYGAICMTPSNENKNKSFCFLIQMIMEHYFQSYKEKCWVCGCENVRTEEDETSGHNKKYRIYCNKCGHFLIETHCHNPHRIQHKYKLGKHICNNYYQPENNSPWNVICVECNNSLQ
ncbi:MAG: hypothetical protein K2J39_06890, partial [Ruminococcus sp.]|nr:hypothetical protein [Ruminococcus sp.]